MSIEPATAEKAEKNEHIVGRIQAGDTEALATLWTMNTGLVAYVAKRYIGLLGERGDCDYDDLMQAGFLGLYQAATKYAPDRGAKFSTYAVFHIMREMRRALGILTEKHDTSVNAISLDAPLYKDSDNITILNTLAVPGEEENPIEREELCAAVRAAVARMKHGAARRTVEAYHFEGMSEAQQAEAEGVSEQSISNRLYRGYRELYNDPELQRWAVDYTYTNLYRTKGIRAFNTSFSSVVEDIVIQAEEQKSKRTALYEVLGSLV